MPTKVNRRTVDLSGFPNLVVIYLGMRVNRLTGLKTLFGFGPRISSSAAAQPDGLLLHEPVFYSMFPPHGGIEAIYDDMPHPIGLLRFAPEVQARGPMFSAAHRAKQEGGSDPVISESDLYGG